MRCIYLSESYTASPFTSKFPAALSYPSLNNPTSFITAHNFEAWPSPPAHFYRYCAVARQIPPLSNSSPTSTTNATSHLSQLRSLHFMSQIPLNRIPSPFIHQPRTPNSGPNMPTNQYLKATPPYHDYPALSGRLSEAHKLDSYGKVTPLNVGHPQSDMYHSLQYKSPLPPFACTSPTTSPSPMAIPLWKPAPIVHVRMRASESAEDSRPTMEDAARITSLIQEYCARKDHSQGRVFRDRDDSPSWNEFVRLLQDVKLGKLTPDQFLHYIDQVFREEQKIKADIHWLMTPGIQEPPSSSSSTID